MKQLNFEEIEAKTSAEFVEEIKSEVLHDFEAVHVKDTETYTEVIIRTKYEVHHFIFWKTRKTFDSDWISLHKLKAVGLTVGA